MVTMQLAVAALAVAGAGETVLLDFQADWCGPCKMMEPVVGQLAAMGYPVRKVNIDHDRALAAQYNVSSIPCFVAVVDGQEKGRLVGATNAQQLIQLARGAGIGPPTANIAQVRGQSPDRRRFGWPRAPRNEPSIRPPMVSLGQPVAESPAATPPPTSPTEPLPAFRGNAPSGPLAAAQATPAETLQPLPRSIRQPQNQFASASNPAAAESPDQALIDRLIQSAVRLRVQDREGFSCGSGSIIDFRPAADGRGGDALVLTCGHLFRDSRGAGPIGVDLFDGSGSRQLPARLLQYDLQRDIGLVSVRTPHTVRAVRLAAPSSKPARGAAVVSIGCDHGRDPTAHASRITAVNSFVGPPNLQVAGQPAVGRSGGGLFNTQGELIGVCNFADPTDRAGLYAAVELARAVMNQNGITLAQSNANDSGMPSIEPPPMPASMPAVATIGKAGGFETRQPSDASAAADSDITEVICIVRSGDGEAAKRQVIVIEDASSDLVQRLAAEQQRQQGTFPTKMDVSTSRRLPAVGQRPVIRTTTDWQPKWR